LLYSVSISLRCIDRRTLHSFPTRRSSDLRAVLRPNQFGRNPRFTPTIVGNSGASKRLGQRSCLLEVSDKAREPVPFEPGCADHQDRKSTRLNSSHVKISYAVFCLKKKTTK